MIYNRLIPKTIVVAIVIVCVFASIYCGCYTKAKTINCSIEFDKPPTSIEYITASNSPMPGVDIEPEPLLFGNNCIGNSFGDDEQHRFGIITEASDLGNCIHSDYMSSTSSTGEQLRSTDFSKNSVLLVELTHPSSMTTAYTLYRIKGNSVKLEFEKWGPDDKASDSVQCQYIFVVNFE